MTDQTPRAGTPQGNIVAQLRKQPRSAIELADVLGVSPNTIRVHLAALERDQVIEVVGQSQGDGPGKPAKVYGLQPTAELRLSRAYVPFLTALLHVLRDEFPESRYRDLFKLVGKRLAPTTLRNPTLPERIAAATDLLGALGGVATVREEPDRVVIEGSGCPLGAVTASHPSVCEALATMLADTVGCVVEECCDRQTDRPSCRFAIAK